MSDADQIRENERNRAKKAVAVAKKLAKLRIELRQLAEGARDEGTLTQSVTIDNAADLLRVSIDQLNSLKPSTERIADLARAMMDAPANDAYRAALQADPTYGAPCPMRAPGETPESFRERTATAGATHFVWPNKES